MVSHPHPLKPELMSAMLNIQVRKPSRMLSGITVVAVMTHPLPCPGECVYCPGGLGYNAPKSYFGNEPAVRRARRNQFHPFKQVYERLRQYEALGHNPSKLEVIIMGGTFLALPESYKKWFIANIYEACNTYPYGSPPLRVDLESAILRNETSRYRVVGLTIETRPDYGRERHADEMLHYGATKVELGVQSIYDDVLEIVRRGHSVKDTIESTRILRDAGFKICYHIMLGLPGSNPDRDLEMVKELFTNPDFRPDMLKIYPTEVIEGTTLYTWWKEGKYKPYSDEDVIELVSEMYRYIPKYVRVMRIRRDIPADEVAAGTRYANLREMIEKSAIEKGIEIQEIRFREAGLQMYKYGKTPDPSRTNITRLTYEAGGGIEEFLAVEDTASNILIGFLRMRVPSEKAHRWEIDRDTAIIRELHIYGPETPVGEKGVWFQHVGWGRKLVEKAEDIALNKYGVKKILVISGVGAREYYRRLGYFHPPESPYMFKYLK
ncbi:elongator complex protein 3 [Desulfurococcus amylolyticus]|uniref:elongator complex protein 3 n=1 Tax=Desulfurococcus amylolyticus TaxID=94694 RepID=UPI000A6EC894|nr:elongator complex protein 3 [Desulfurococcus amylolyticus]